MDEVIAALLDYLRKIGLAWSRCSCTRRSRLCARH